MKNFIKVMKALSDKTRVKIIKMLQYRELCVCEIREGLQLAQPTISKHLKLLEDAGLIVSRKEGPWVNYFFNKNPDDIYSTAMLEHLKIWLEDDEEISGLIKILPDLDRKKICR